MRFSITCLLGVLSLHSQVICLRFEKKTYPQVILTKARDGPYAYNSSAEQRMKLCYYAKLKAELLYIDLSYVPEWKELYAPIELPEPFGFGMFCATLPTIYLIRHSKEYETIQITQVESQVRHYQFDTNPIIHADLITLHADLQPAFKGANLLELGPEDRKNLCIAAGEHITLQFLDYNVPPAQPYKFKHAHISEIDVAIPCPTSPQLYLRRGDSETEVKLILHPSLIDTYKFEVNTMKPSLVIPVSEEEPIPRIPSRLDASSLTRLGSQERRALCSIARKHGSDFDKLLPLVHDDSIPEARLYLFKYQNGREEQFVSIACPALPLIFLYLDDTSMLGNLIKITFMATLADDYFYKIVISGPNTFQSTYESSKNTMDERDREVVANHLFNRLGKENCWNLCFGAQKDLLEESTLTFQHTKVEAIDRHYQILLTSQYIKNPRLYEIKYEDGSKRKDVFIQCSTLPDFRIRLGQSSNTIEIFIDYYEVYDSDYYR